jgi:hypothetical protein
LLQLTANKRARRQSLNDTFNSNQELTEEAVSASMLKFEKHVEQFRTPICIICSRISLLTHVPRDEVNFECLRCKPKKTRKNDMKDQERNYDENCDRYEIEQENANSSILLKDFVKPCSIPDELRANMLTFIEEQLIALVFVQQFVYLRGFGEVASKGHCINFSQDITEIAEVLPRLPSEMPLVIIKRKNTDEISSDIKFRRSVILLWLTYLKNNSIVPGYRNVVISHERLNNLPEDGLPEGLTIIESENESFIEHLQPSIQNDTSNHDIRLNTNTSGDDRYRLQEEPNHDEQPQVESGVVCPPGLVQQESNMLNNFVENITNDQTKEIEFPKHSQTPLSEFNTPYLASMAFPSLFPNGIGDPFSISKSHKPETLLNKVKNLLYFAEMIGEDMECRFAQHSRFVMWIHNILYRHKTLGQGHVYLQHNENDRLLTTDQIKSMLENGRINEVINNLKRYVANIPGSSSYLQSVHNDLLSIIDSKGPPHVFFTHSYADFYDPFLHEFLKIPKNSPRNVIHKRLRKYPHLVNWFFIQKFKDFAKQFYIKHLNACPEKGGWLWYRFEWQHRGAIHVHGLLRMGGMPDTYELSRKCITGHVLSLKSNPTADEMLLIEEGQDAEEILKSLYDEYVNCDTLYSSSINEICNNANVNAPRPQSLKASDITHKEDDLQSLIVSLQRHVCKVGGCQKTFNGVLQPCRFKFPQDKSDETQLKYENKKKNRQDADNWVMQVIPKRSYDDRIASHNKHQLRYWRANVDFSIVHDYNKVIKYVSKYATKSETKSNAYKAAFDEIYSNPLVDTRTTQQNLRKVMNKVLGQRDISMHEALHLCMSLDLHWSNVSIVKTSITKSNSIAKNKKTGNLKTGIVLN